MKRQVRAHNDRAWLAWQTARLMHFHHDPRKLPALRTITVREPSQRRRQSSEQQLQIVRAMHAAFSAVSRSRKTKKNSG